MLILGIDTATPQVGCAVGGHEGVLASFHAARGRRHAEVLDDGGVALVEWGDVIIPTLPADFLEVRLRFGVGDDDRVIEVQPVGPSWNARTRALGQALSPWTNAC